MDNTTETETSTKIGACTNQIPVSPFLPFPVSFSEVACLHYVAQIGRMSERRYSEADVAEIFRVAADLEHSGPRAIARTDGLTLSELQQIGKEAGFSPEAVAQAVRLHAGDGSASTSRFLGLPLGVAHTVELDRPLADTEWEQLVGQLRDTFEAKGAIKYEGPFRQWSNGNLHVLVEPTATGHRVRFRTTNGLSRAMLRGAIALLAIVFVAVAVGADPREGMMAGSLALAVGALGALRLPSWANRRREQMRQLARRLVGARSVGTPNLPGADDR